ncbi:MAG: ACT domain-containing protein [Candidatus Ranarchaeia archaeon]
MQDNQPISIAMAARRSAASHPSVLDGMRMKIINYSGLTEKLLPEIKQLTKNPKINVNAVKIALIRYGEKIAKEWRLKEKKCVHVLKDTVVELRNDLFVMTVRKGSVKQIQEVLRKIDEFRFFQLVKGTDSFTIAIDQQHQELLVQLFPKSQVLSILADQAALVLISPPLIIDTPGVLSYTTNLLSDHGINITQMFSCHLDTVFIIERKDAVRAFELVEQKIRDLRLSFKRQRV